MRSPQTEPTIASILAGDSGFAKGSDPADTCAETFSIGNMPYLGEVIVNRRRCRLRKNGKTISKPGRRRKAVTDFAECSMSFAGQTAIVTGASSGIGWAVAKVLAAEGCRVGLIARRQPNLESLAGEIRQAGGRAAW